MFHSSKLRLLSPVLFLLLGPLSGTGWAGPDAFTRKFIAEARRNDKTMRSLMLHAAAFAHPGRGPRSVLVRDPHGLVLGRVEGRTGRVLGKLDRHNMEHLGRVRGDGVLYDANGAKIGSVRHGEVFDTTGIFVGRVSKRGEMFTRYKRYLGRATR